MAPHKDRLDLSRLLSYLIMAKNLWQWGAPQFRYDPRRRRVQLIRNGVVIIEFTVAKGRAHQARSLVRDINRKFNACEYPTLGDAEKLQDLAAP